MVNLEKMTGLVQGIKVSYKPRLLESQPPVVYEVKVEYNVADDQMIGDDLDQGWYKNYDRK